MLRLVSLAVGEIAVIRGFEGTRKDPDFAEREAVVLALMRAGFLPGAKVAVAARGLGGDPLACDVRGARVAIGASEAALIEVERTESP